MVATELWLVAQALQGVLAPSPPNQARGQTWNAEQPCARDWPGPSTPGGLQTHPAPALPVPSTFELLELCRPHPMVLQLLWGRCCCKGQLLKPSLLWQCHRTCQELPQGSHCEVTSSDSSPGVTPDGYAREEDLGETVQGCFQEQRSLLLELISSLGSVGKGAGQTTRPLGLGSCSARCCGDLLAPCGRLTLC